MKTAWFALAASLLLGLAGCASTPQASAERDADAKAFDTHPGAATVYVYRSPLDTDYEDNVLYVDGRLIGSTVPGTYFRMNLPPGKHRLHGTGIDQGQLALDARPGRLYFVELTVIAGTSQYQPVPAEQAKRAIASCCVLLENWAPGQRPLLR